MIIELEARRHSDEAAALAEVLDFSARMRLLSQMANEFTKNLSAYDTLKDLNLIRHFLNHWKGLCVRTFDFTNLSLSNKLPAKIREDEQKYVNWPASVCTAVYVSEQFLKRVCMSTGLPLIDHEPTLLVKNTNSEEFLLALKIEEFFNKKPVSAAALLGQ